MAGARDKFFDDLAMIGFVREYRFHPKRRWLFDLALPELRIACEYNGIMNLGPSHASVKGLLRDAEKFNEAQKLGWIVVIANAINVKDGSAWAFVVDAVESRGGHIG